MKLKQLSDIIPIDKLQELLEQLEDEELEELIICIRNRHLST